jgi:Tol biopolymer transport system component
VASGEHLVTLDEYPTQCQVDEGPARTVIVSAGDTVVARFDLSCPNDSGALVVRLSVSGDDQDPNGYTVLLDGQPQGSGLFGTIALRAVAGSHTLEVTDATPSCPVHGDRIRTLLIPSGGTVTVDFEIVCTLSPRAGRGQEIVFETHRGGHNPFGSDVIQLYSVNLDGTGLQLLSAIPAGLQTAASWSPDGTRLLFSAESPGFDDVIFIMNADGSGAAPYLNTDGESAWSPDVNRVALSFEDEENETNRIATLPFENADLDNLEVLASGDDLSRPSWSPNGQQLAFMSGVFDGDGGIFHTLQVLDVSTLERDTLSLELERLAPPQWSPDGDWLLFAGAPEPDAARDLYLVHPNGMGLTQLTDTPDDEMTPAWSPDGTRIAFATDRDGNYEIYVMQTDGTQPVRLTNNPGFDGGPAWRP